MPGDEAVRLLWEVIADLLTSASSPEEIMAFRPSPQVQQRVRELLHKSSAGELRADEKRELSQFEQAELVMRLVKSHLIPENSLEPARPIDCRINNGSN